MTLRKLPPSLNSGGGFDNETMRGILSELQGLRITPVTGANAGTAMALADILPEDTIIAALLPSAVTTLARAEIQTITVDAAGGNFSITWNGKTTTPLAYNVLAVDMQAALEALDNINPGDVVVTGGVGASGGGTAYTLTWSATLGNVAAPTTTVTGAGTTLTGGAGTAAVATGTAGITEVSGLVLDDAANITIQDNTASGTITFTGDPVAAETLVVGLNTYTFRATATGVLGDVLITPSSVTLQAAAMAAAINLVETQPLPFLLSSARKPMVVATSALGVVTVTSVGQGVGNGVVVVGTATVLAAANSASASATLTPASVVATNTAKISGVTFTARAAPTLETEFKVESTDALQGATLAKAINHYEEAHGTLDVKAVAHATTGVVTLTPRTALKGNIIPLTESATNTAVSGSGTLAGGLNTGTIKSTSGLLGIGLVVYWFNKN